MLDFNAGEILLLVVLAVIIFGPEKLPDLARKAARVVNYLRGVANDARGQLREYAPELADLGIADLNPRTLGVKLLGADSVADLSETGRAASREVSEVARQVASREPDLTPLPPSPRVIAFDPEAT